MALSGTISQAYQGWHYRMYWTAKQSIPDNTSTITIDHWLDCDSGYDLYIGSRNNTCTVDGKEKAFTSSAISTGGGNSVKLGTTTHVVTHNDNGQKSCNISGQFNVQATLAGTYKSSISASGNITLDTIARASQPSCITWPEHTQDVGNFGDTISIHMNRKSDQFTHTVRYAYGSLTGTIATGVTTGTTWKIPESFMNLIPSHTAGQGTIYVDTYNGSTKIGTKWCGFVATVPASVKPSCTATLEDITGIDDIYGSPVQGLSKIKITVKPTLAYSSPIRDYNISCDGIGYFGEKAELTTGFLTSSGTSPIVVKVTDNRGRSGSWTYNMNVQAYTPPAVTKLVATRCDANGTNKKRGDHVKVTFSAKVSAIGNKNTASYTLKYKKTSATAWTVLTEDVKGNKPSALNNNYTPTDQTYIFAVSTGNSYDIVVEVVDRHNSSNPASKSTKVPTASSVFSWRGFRTSTAIEDGAGIGKVPEKPNTLQVGWDSEFEKSVRGKVFGLGTLDLIPDDSNIDDYYKPGVYSIATDASAETMTNLPRAVAGRLIVSDSTGTEPAEGVLWEYKEQLFLPHDIGRGGIPWVRQVRRAGSTQWVYYGWQSFALFSYPVGSIYIAYNHTNPGTLFGGTWVRMSNTFLWGADSSGTIGQTGGEKTHTLTIAEMPSHKHQLVRPKWYGRDGDGFQTDVLSSSSGAIFGTSSTTTPSYISRLDGNTDILHNGSSAAHNNMPPYTHVSIWRRTA